MDPVADMIRQHFPSVAASRLEKLPHPGWGGDSDAWLVDDRWIFRFPRTTEVAARLSIEVCLLPELAPRLPLRVPRFVHVARDIGPLPRFVGYEAIPGAPLRGDTLQRLPWSVRDQVARELGAFLRALHRTALDTAVACGIIRPDGSARAAAERRYQNVREQVFPLLGQREQAWVRRRFEGYLADPRHFTFAPVMCHGDLSSDHILFDPDRNRLTGIIDFGDVAIGDPAGEFTWKEEYGEEFFDTALLAYAIADESFAERVNFRIDCLPLSQIAYGVETGRTVDTGAGVRDLLRTIARSAS